jgi:hypothetical protein
VAAGPRGTRGQVLLSSGGPGWRIEMRWGIVEWRLHVYGWVILCVCECCTGYV